MIITSLERVSATSPSGRDDAGDASERGGLTAVHHITSPAQAEGALSALSKADPGEIELLRSSLLQVAALAQESQLLLLAERDRHAQEVNELRASIEIESF